MDRCFRLLLSVCIWTVGWPWGWVDGGPVHQEPAMQFTPTEPIMDEPVIIRITGLPGKAKVTVRAFLESAPEWQSEATFAANDEGVVDVSQQAPLSGSYTGTDAMGLFWSMTAKSATTTPATPQPTKASTRSVTDPRLTVFEVIVNGQTQTTAKLKRWLARPGLQIKEVREQGLVGRLFTPAPPGKYPALLVLSGSEGGIPETEAALLASHGYCAFALAYFNAPSLPDQLMNIPLEYLKQGIDWLLAQEQVDRERIGVIGGSKGGELSLLLAATFPEIKAVVAKVPSSVVWAGIPKGGMAFGSSWKYQDQALPFLPFSFNAEVFRKMRGTEPVALLDLYAPALKNTQAVQRALIPVEKIHGPVLLISGTDDRMWPSAEMSDMVVERLKQKGFTHPVQHLKYAGAGHGILSMYVPIKQSLIMGRYDLGGTVQANARAQADSRKQTLAFLAQALKQ